MSTKGGYLIVDLKGNDIATLAGEVIPGIYETLEGNYGKPVLVSGIVVDGVEKPDVFVSVRLFEGGFYLDIYGYQIDIEPDDDVYTEGLTIPNIYRHQIEARSDDFYPVFISFLSTDPKPIEDIVTLFSMRSKFAHTSVVVEDGSTAGVAGGISPRIIGSNGVFDVSIENSEFVIDGSWDFQDTVVAI